MAKAVMIIAFQGFRDEEYILPKETLEKAGIDVTTASTELGIANGKLGITAQVDILLKDLKVSEYDAIIFIGGPGSYDFFDDPTAQAIAKSAVKQDKVLAAICAAPGILSKAGLLKGKRAACFTGISYLLVNSGAKYSGNGIEVDGKIITADGPTHARQFSEAIIGML
jgi:deglycase